MGTESEAPIERHEDLFAPFLHAMKPRSAHRIGTESEKFGVVAATGEPLPYDGDHGVVGVLRALRDGADWAESNETAGGPLIALVRGQASITLEPGAQLELSGAPLDSVHDIEAELDDHLAELERACVGKGIAWLGVGFHPLAKQSDLPWVPKARYAIMRDYFPTRGTRGLDMMRRTATVQANLDYCDEQDAMRKLRVALRLAPVGAAMFANSPFYEGAVAGKRSLRAEVWLDVDPDRTGVLPTVLRDGSRLDDYVEWALDAPMYLFKRAGSVVSNTGQTFRAFLREGFHGHRAVPADWELHINTLFPEVRLKRTIELRSTDSLPRRLLCAMPALWAGLLYDEQALAAVEALVERVDAPALDACRQQVPTLGLGARLAERPVVSWAEQLLDIAAGGLERRARLDPKGHDERRHLESLVALVAHGRSPADDLLEGLAEGPLDPATVVQRTLV